MCKIRTTTRVCLLAAICLWPAVSSGQVTPPAAVGDISGVIRDISSGKALSPANILILGTNWGAMSLENGSFVIKNVPVDTYEIKVQMMGYGDKTISGIVIKEGQTVHVTFDLREEIVSVIPEVQVTGKRPLIDKKRTGTAHHVRAEDIADLPVDDFEEVIGLKAGVIAKGGELHFRGGRGGEVQFQVDGMPVRDPLVGGGISLATLAVAEVEVLTGGLDAKYGNAQSGVVIYRTKEGGDRFSGELRYITDDYGSPTNTYDNYDRLFVGLGGPVPIRNMNYYLSVEATFQDNYPKTVERRSRTKLLNFISVGDRKSNAIKLQGKISYKPGANYKLTVELIDQETRYDNYQHSWSRDGYVQTFLDTTRTDEVVVRHGRWSPVRVDSTYHYYNAAEHTPNVLDQFRQYKAVFHHSLSQDAQYSIRVSMQRFFQDQRVQDKKEWEYDGRRDIDLWYNYTDREANDFFVISGDYPTVSTRETQVSQGMWDLTWKRGRHTFETGLSGTYNDMRYFTLDRPYLNSGDGKIGYPRTDYHYYNPEGAAYIQDRWEHEGMLLNFGLRYDVFSVGEQVPLTEVREPVKKQLSPRMGIGYPISDRDVFSFHYGRLYQIPDRRYIFDNQDVFDRTRGNPNLTNETTVQYQAAIQHLFSDILVGQFSIYYKDIFGLISAEEQPDWTSTGNITTYVNKDYASSQGFEVSLSRSFRNYMRWDFSYAYGVAKGVASDPDAAVSRNFVYLPTSEQALNWDVRHSLGASFYLGDRRNWGVSMTWNYLTGSPYTPYQRDTRQLEPEMVNSRRLPSTTTLDVRVDKYFWLWTHRLSLFLQGRNIMDAKNITTLTPGNWPGPPVGSAYTVYYTEAGKAGGAYLKDVSGDGIEEFVPLNDPRVFGSPRSIRVGLGFEF
jgi:outer membrane receptor for ferrienterochelin and colicin